MSIDTVVNINNYEIISKILISIALGFIIGLERELTNKAAGLRTHILVCLGSTVFTLISIYGFDISNIHDGIRIQNDPARIAAQILTGIGFIGGGAVLHHGVSVSGLTTAASLWITASIGMAVGTGSYTLAISTTIIAFVVLVVIRIVEREFLSKFTQKGVRLRLSVYSRSIYAPVIQDWITKEFDGIVEMGVIKTTTDDDMVKISFILDVIGNNPMGLTYKKLQELKNVESLTLQKIIDEN